jgi:NitT/TauT family transport system substrate-binding protein
MRGQGFSFVRVGLGRIATVLALVALAATPLESTAAELVPVKVGVLRIASQAPFFMGVEKGYFHEAGVDVELVFFDAAVPATLAIASRDVDLAVIGFTPAFFNLAYFGGVVVIAGHSRELPGFPNTGVFASNKAWDAGVRTMADLRGRVIGLTTIGSTNHYAVARIGEKYGFDVNDNHLVPAQGLGNLAAMLMGNQVDVASGAGTAFMGLIDKGQAHVIGWAGDEVSWQSTGLASSPRIIAEKRAALQAVIDSYERGAAEYSAVLLDRNQDGTYKDQALAEELLGLISRWTSVPPKAIAQSLAYIDSRLDVQSVYEMVEWYRGQRMIEKDTDPAKFIDLSFVPGHENIPAAMRAGR